MENLMKNSIILLALFLLFVPTSSAYGFVTRITWNPVSPVEGDAVTVNIQGRWPTGCSVRSEFSQNDHELRADLNLRANGFQIITLYGSSNTWNDLPSGDYTLLVRLTIIQMDGQQEERDYRSAITVLPVDDDQRIVFTPGWNLVGIPLHLNASIPELFQPLVDQGLLRMVKDGLGRYYRPDQDFNNLPDFDFRTGYQVFVTEGCWLDLDGAVIEPETPIRLREGWNMVAFLPQQRINAPAAFSNIAGELIMAKDGVGHFYYPARDFDNLSPLLARQGFLVRVSQEVQLIWNIP
jgi:hypothetical protein